MDTPRDELTGAIDDLLREIVGDYLRPPTPPPDDMSMTIGQMHCLRTLSRLGKPTMSELAEALSLHPSTVTVLVDALVSHGLVERQADPEDRRVVRVQETTKGSKGRRKHLKAMRAMMIHLLGDLGDEDLARIHDALSTLREAARRRLDAGPGKPKTHSGECGAAGHSE